MRITRKFENRNFIQHKMSVLDIINGLGGYPNFLRITAGLKGHFMT